MKILYFTPIFEPDFASEQNIIAALSCNVDYALFLNSAFEVPNGCFPIIFGNSENIGISKAFNEVMSFAKRQDYDYVMFLDQDTRVDLGQVKKVLPNYLNKVNQATTAVIYLRTSMLGERPYGNFITNSGALFSVYHFKKLGGFNEKYEVDGLDYEFCVRIWRNNLKVMNVPLLKYFDHISLQEGRSIRFCGRQIFLRRYSNRRYKEMQSFYMDLLKSCWTERESRLLFIVARSFLIFRFGKLISFFYGLIAR